MRDSTSQNQQQDTQQTTKLSTGLTCSPVLGVRHHGLQGAVVPRVAYPRGLVQPVPGAELSPGAGHGVGRLRRAVVAGRAHVAPVAGRRGGRGAAAAVEAALADAGRVGQAHAGAERTTLGGKG